MTGPKLISGPGVGEEKKREVALLTLEVENLRIRVLGLLTTPQADFRNFLDQFAQIAEEAPEETLTIVKEELERVSQKILGKPGFFQMDAIETTSLPMVVAMGITCASFIYLLNSSYTKDTEGIRIGTWGILFGIWSAVGLLARHIYYKSKVDRLTLTTRKVFVDELLEVYKSRIQDLKDARAYDGAEVNVNTARIQDSQEKPFSMD